MNRALIIMRLCPGEWQAGPAVAYQTDWNADWYGQVGYAITCFDNFQWEFLEIFAMACFERVFLPAQEHGLFLQLVTVTRLWQIGQLNNCWCELCRDWTMDKWTCMKGNMVYFRTFTKRENAPGGLPKNPNCLLPLGTSIHHHHNAAVY